MKEERVERKEKRKRREERESKRERRKRIRLQWIIVCDQIITSSEFLPCSHHSVLDATCQV